MSNKLEIDSVKVLEGVRPDAPDDEYGIRIVAGTHAVILAGRGTRAVIEEQADYIRGQRWITLEEPELTAIPVLSGLDSTEEQT